MRSIIPTVAILAALAPAGTGGPTRVEADEHRSALPTRSEAATPATDSAGESALSAAEATGARRACVEMIEAWYGGDADVMARVLHDDLAKRGVLRDQPGTVIAFANKAQMVDGARRGTGKIPRREWNIRATLVDQHPAMATVRVTSKYLIDVCQVARLPHGWMVVNVIWTNRGTPPWWK